MDTDHGKFDITFFQENSEQCGRIVASGTSWYEHWKNYAGLTDKRVIHRLGRLLFDESVIAFAQDHGGKLHGDIWPDGHTEAGCRRLFIKYFVQGYTSGDNPR